jgi:DNA polymerase type B, organellar and viral
MNTKGGEIVKDFTDTLYLLIALFAGYAMPIQNEDTRKKYYKEYKRKPRGKRNYRETEYIKAKEFICFDGESENDKYTLLGNSGNYIYRKEGLSTYESLKFLYYEGQGKIKIFFSMHYDIQMIIKDLSDEQILLLLDNEDVKYGNFNLHYIPKRYLTIGKNGKRVYIYDIFSFFQTSLLKTIDQMKLDLTDHEKKVLERGKILRGENFRNMSKKQIIEYNKTECIVTEKIAIKLRGILLRTKLEANGKKFNLCPTRFYGSGAVAKKILKNLEFEKYHGHETDLPDKIKKFIYMSYYGGRAECFKIGTFKNVWKYDINSAYPSAMNDLCLPLTYRIRRPGKDKIIWNDKNIYHIEFDFRFCDAELIGILPIRRKDGYVIFPKRGRGYWYGCEAKYLDKYRDGSYKVIEILEIKYSDVPVFEIGFINGIYETRLQLKKKEDISQIAYKLSINSLYGKLAQQTGASIYQNILFASYITANCRSKILEAIFNSDAVKNTLQISTDGIFTDKRINVNIGESLGEWEELNYKKAIILGSGVYGLYSENSKFAIRGFEVSEGNFNKIYERLEKNKKVTLTYKAFIGHKLAIANKKAYGVSRLKFIELEKTFTPFEYEKRLFLRKHKITQITGGMWFDIYPGKIIETFPLKKFDLDLLQEAIELSIK